MSYRPAPNRLEAHPVEALPPHPLGLQRSRLAAVLRRDNLCGPGSFLVLVALVFLFMVATGIFIYLFFVSRRKSNDLERQAIAVRAAMVEEKLAGNKRTQPEMPM